MWDEVAVFVNKLGPGRQEIAVVEIEQRAPTRGGSVLVSGVRILQGSKLILPDNLPYRKTPVPLKEKATNKTRGNNKGDRGPQVTTTSQLIWRQNEGFRSCKTKGKYLLIIQKCNMP